jgi:hypothetical protein
MPGLRKRAPGHAFLNTGPVPRTHNPQSLAAAACGAPGLLFGVAHGGRGSHRAPFGIEPLDLGSFALEFNLGDDPFPSWITDRIARGGYAERLGTSRRAAQIRDNGCVR